jgi:hypothetical protein
VYDLVPIVAIFFTIGVPSLALAGHLVLRPMVRDIITAVDERLARLEDRYSHLETQVTRLLEAESFLRELGSGRAER